MIIAKKCWYHLDHQSNNHQNCNHRNYENKDVATTCESCETIDRYNQETCENMRIHVKTCGINRPEKLVD